MKFHPIRWEAAGIKIDHTNVTLIFEKCWKCMNMIKKPTTTCFLPTYTTIEMLSRPKKGKKRNVTIDTFDPLPLGWVDQDLLLTLLTHFCWDEKWTLA